MPPRASARVQSEPASFPTWDELTAEAAGVLNPEPYVLPLPDGKSVKILLDGARYIELSGAQQRGDLEAVRNVLFPMKPDREAFMRAMVGAPMTMLDVVAAKVVRHHFGMAVEPGKSSTS